MTYEFDLGGYSRPVSTESAEAQAWFDRGLNWLYGFNHDEAIACFNKALLFDPQLAMAYWGLALACGPNYNIIWEAFSNEMLAVKLPEIRRYVAAAKSHMHAATPVEQALVQAIASRYQSDAPPEDRAELQQWSAAYLDAMRDVYQRFSDDPDVAALFADAILNLTPWKLWDLRTGEPAQGAFANECKQVLETAITALREEGGRPHPGIWHNYVHLMEMSPVPEQALPAADDLRRLVPDAGHLMHMATHIDVQCGDYQAVVDWNRAATVADLKYWRYGGAFNTYSAYRAHNYHFQLYGAMFLGQLQPALQAVEGMGRTLPEPVLRRMPPLLREMLEPFFATKTHALIRFGKWQQLVDEPVPADAELYAVSTAFNYYGKAIAHANLKQFDQARDALARFEQSAGRIDQKRRMHTTRVHDIFGVAREMIYGETAYHEGNHELAFVHLRRAVELDDALPYDEPRGWMMPTRHPLGAILLEQGHFEEAASVYEADLGLNDTVVRAGRHPNNVWSLLGLHECYIKLGRATEAALIKPALDVALARADPEVASSCFCSAPLGGQCCD